MTKKMILSVIALAAAAFWFTPAAAQSTYAKTSQIWSSQARIPDISVTSSSPATQLPAIGQIARLCNTGSNDAYVAFGTSAVTVTAANGSKLVAGTCWGYDLMPFPAPLPFQYVAAITASSTTTIYVETGIGSPPLQIGSSGGSGSNASVGATGTTPPTSATLTGMTQGGNLVAMTGTAGNLNVQCANCSGSGVSTADEVAFLAGTSLFAGGGGFFQTTVTNNALTDGKQGMFQVTANRALFSNMRNAAGAEVGVAAAPLQVSVANTGANATAMLVTANAGTNLNTSALALETGGNLATIAGAITASVVQSNTKQVNGVTTLAGAGAVGTGAQRVAVGQDTTTIAGSAPGTAGTASTNVMTVQGIAAMTKLLVTPDSVALPANQSVNVSQINGVTPLMGNGVTGTGSPRVTIASDNTAFSVNATLSAETTKVIGTTRVTGNVGGVLDAIGQNVTAPANWLQAGCQFTTSPTTISSGSGSPLSCANDNSLRVTVVSATGLADASTSSGQTFSKIGANVTTAAPSYSTGQTDPLSLTTSGALRHDITSVNSVAILTGTGAVGTGAQRIAVGIDTATIAGSAPGTAGTASTNVMTVQGIAAMTKLLVTPDSVALPANQSVNVAQFGGVSTAAGQVAVSTAPVTATNTALVVDLRPDSPGIIATGGSTTALSVPTNFNSQYPVNSVTTTPTAVTATATGTTAATAATLAATASVTNYICGFTITADATALATGTATVSGTISGSLNYLQTIVAVTSGTSDLTKNFSPCIPASGANVAITVTSAAAGTGGNTIVNVQGYRL